MNSKEKIQITAKQNCKHPKDFPGSQAAYWTLGNERCWVEVVSMLIHPNSDYAWVKVWVPGNKEQPKGIINYAHPDELTPYGPVAKEILNA